MSTDTFQTINAISEGIYKEKGSKFFAYAYPIKTEEEAKKIVKGLRKEYYDARHHCSAFVLGAQGDRYLASDDGEPSNSAGNPILGQIRSRELTNVLVVVVRYFGGTKLGVSGLIHAYKTSAADALDNAEIVQEYEKCIFSIAFEYPEMDKVMRQVKVHELDIVSQTFEISCELVFAVRKSKVEEVLKELDDFGKLKEL